MGIVLKIKVPGQFDMEMQFERSHDMTFFSFLPNYPFKCENE
jgi:hypothetical protein